jgi:apolipoprotein N-acyltransferase
MRALPASMLLLLTAIAAQPFANGRWIVPVIAWLAPLLLIRLIRTQPRGRGLALGWLVFTVGWAVQWWDIINVPRAWFVLVALACGTTGFLPYVADRWLAPRLRGLLATLVFPAAQVGIEVMLSRASPNGTWGSLAYTQYGDLPLMQLASVTGVYGISFLVAWFASTASFLWDHRQWPPQIIRASAAFGFVLVAVLVAGGSRIALAPTDAATLRIATVAPSESRPHDPAFSTVALADLFSRSAQQAAGGAKVILWPEDSFFVFKTDEPAVIERARAFAREHHVHLGMAYGARLAPDTPRYQNKFVLVAPDGTIAWEYLKNHPVPGREQSLVERGEGGLVLHETPSARFAGAICYDGDFPDLFHKAGHANVIFLPADDWRAIDPLHARMAVFRAIEHGASIVRPTMNGLSIAANHLGEVMATSDYFISSDHMMSASVPLTRVDTLYSRIGDLFAWLCVAGLIALAVASRAWTRST